jgi:hypothetical protein
MGSVTSSRRQYYGRYEPYYRVSIEEDRYLRQALNVLNTLRTGDENSRDWRFFFTTVKDRRHKFAF